MGNCAVTAVHSIEFWCGNHFDSNSKIIENCFIVWYIFDMALAIIKSQTRKQIPTLNMEYKAPQNS